MTTAPNSLEETPQEASGLLWCLLKPVVQSHLTKYHRPLSPKPENFILDLQLVGQLLSQQVSHDERILCMNRNV